MEHVQQPPRFEHAREFGERSPLVAAMLGDVLDHAEGEYRIERCVGVGQAGLMFAFDKGNILFALEKDGLLGKGKSIAAFAISELEAGSDVAALKMTAEPD